jgi:trimeric autotransporter adhesin
MRKGTGIWGLISDSTGVVWAGGDVATVATSSKTNHYAGGFARFPLNDSTPPTVPTQLAVSSQTATTVTLTWQKSTDAVGGTFYEILRDDRPIAATPGNVNTITVPLGGTTASSSGPRTRPGTTRPAPRCCWCSDIIVRP